MTRATSTNAAIEHQIGPNGRVSIKVADWDLQLVVGADDVARVVDAGGTGLPEDLEVERGTNSLSIRQPSRLPDGGFVLRDERDGRRLRIEVPAHTAVSIQTASGDVTMAGLRGEQHLRTASGDIGLDVAGGDVTTESVSGAITIRIDGSIGLAVKTVSGDVSVEGGRVERVRLTTTSGDVRLTSELGPGPHAIATVSGDAILLSERGLRITAVTVAGDLSSDLPHTSAGGPGRRSLVVGDGAAELQFRSVSGDLRVLDPAVAANGPGSWPPPPIAPVPPSPPVAPATPTAPQPPAFAVGPGIASNDGDGSDQPDETEAARLEILRALEKGEINIAEATEQLAGLDGSADD